MKRKGLLLLLEVLLLEGGEVDEWARSAARRAWRRERAWVPVSLGEERALLFGGRRDGMSGVFLLSGS